MAHLLLLHVLMKIKINSLKTGIRYGIGLMGTFFFNRWALYFVQYCRIFSRCSFFTSSSRGYHENHELSLKLCCTVCLPCKSVSPSSFMSFLVSVSRVERIPCFTRSRRSICCEKMLSHYYRKLFCFIWRLELFLCLEIEQGSLSV